MVQTHKCLIPNLFPHTKAYSHTLADDLEEIINYPPKVNPQFVLYFIPLCFRVLCQMGQRATSRTVEWTRFKPRSWSDLNIFLVRVSFFFIIIIFKALGFTVETKHLNLVRCARVNKIKKARNLERSLPLGGESQHFEKLWIFQFSGGSRIWQSRRSAWVMPI